ncbi:MAG TPA: DUF2784 family protein [Verrucomicrobiae bacterium]|nr:DUF2784 family protein [Verrucomicrobiae bacterium]
MNAISVNEFLANQIATVHISWVLYTVLVFIWTVAAFFVHRQFLDWFQFRTVHLVSVILIALLPRFGMNCPLSIAEFYLRMGTDSAFVEGFALHYLRKFIHEGIGPAFVDGFTLAMYLGTLAAYLYRPPKRTAAWFNRFAGEKAKILVERKG